MSDGKRELAAWGRRQLADHPELQERLREAVCQAATDVMHGFDETRQRQRLRAENIDDFDAEFPPEDRDPPVVFVPADMKCASPAHRLALMAAVLDRYSPKPLVAPWGVEGDSPAITSDAHSMWYWHLWDAVGEWEPDAEQIGRLQATAEKYCSESTVEVGMAGEDLTESEREALQALSELGAVSEGKRRTLADIAEKAQGQADPELYKWAVSQLGHKGFVHTKRGRQGGIWLTIAGQERATKR